MPKTDAKPKPACFIIMPITTPPDLVDQYGGDMDHFRHVLEHLFVPAVEKAGFTPVRPTTTGSDVIQAEIIRHLETADMVLCDMSILNANVFFELGIRTAVDKPTCMVKDTLTPRVPFDTSIVNYHTYAASLAPWELAGEVEALANHVATSAERCKGQNKLWSYFGLTKRAETQAPESPLEAKVDAILSHLERASTVAESTASERAIEVSSMMNACAAVFGTTGTGLRGMQENRPEQLTLNLGSAPSKEQVAHVASLVRRSGVNVKIFYPGDDAYLDLTRHGTFRRKLPSASPGAGGFVELHREGVTVTDILGGGPAAPSNPA